MERNTETPATERLPPSRSAPSEVGRRLRALREVTASVPVGDERTADEILGYDDNGLPA